MALNSGVLKGIMKAKLLGLLGALYSDIADDHTLSGYTYDEYLDKFCQGVSEAVVEHVTASARAIGPDSGGFTHDLPIF